MLGRRLTLQHSGFHGLGSLNSINSLGSLGDATEPNLGETLLTSGVDTGLSILKDIYGGPQPGTYIRTPQGGIYERLPENTTFATSGFDLTGATGSSSSLLLWGALGIGVLMLASRGKGSAN